MKQKFYYLFLFLPLLAFLLGACSDKDEVLGSGNTGVISFQADLGKKGFTRGTLDHTFDGTEQIAITMRAVDANANGWPTPRRYVADGEGQLSHSPVANDANDVPWRWPKDAEAIEVKGWYTADQYRSAVNGEQFSVPADQHVRLDIQGYDFLYAPATTFSDRTASSLLLPFWHQMTLVRIYVQNQQPFTNDVISSVRLFGTDWKQNGTYTEPSGDATFGSWNTSTAGTAFTQGITPFHSSISDDGKTALFLAMIVPQPTRGRQLISFVQDNTTYTYTLPATEEASPDFLPGMVYTYDLRMDQQLTVTASLWEHEMHPNFTTTANPWEGVDENSATYVNVTAWLSANHDENRVTTNPWLPADDFAQTDVNFWIVNWEKQDTTAMMDYITLRKATDKDSIPVQTQDTLMYTADGWYIYSGGAATTNWSQIGGGFSPPTYTTRTEGYMEWAISAWETGRINLTEPNSTMKSPWAFRVDDNSRLKNKTINALRLKSASTGSKTIKLYKKTRNTAFNLTETPAATATFTSTVVGEEVIAKLNTPLTLGDLEYLVIDAPASTFYYDDEYWEMFYCNANTTQWASFGASLGIDVGYLADPRTEGNDTWYITSYTDNAANLTASRGVAASPFAGYVYPLTMQVRLRGHAFNALRFKCKTPGSSFKVFKARRDGTIVEEYTVTVPSTASDGAVVTCYLKKNDAITSATLANDEYLVIDGGLSNYYSATGGTFSDYDADSYYLYGPEGYYTIDDESALSTWTWDGNQYGLLGVDVGYVANP